MNSIAPPSSLRVVTILISVLCCIHVMVIKDLGVPVDYHVSISPSANGSRIRSHHDLPRIYRQVGVIEGPIELLFCLWFIGRVVVWSKIWICQCFAGFDSFPWIKDKHTLEKFDGYTLCQYYLNTLV